VAKCESIEEMGGSWIFKFSYNNLSKNITVEKGSICINGTSLTIVESNPFSFSVAIIPYTYTNTTFHILKAGDLVNIEFDMIGKYIAKIIK
jgi:riboflavin synthase